MATTSSFIDALLSDGPAADREAKMALYGWLVGRWEMDVMAHAEDGTRHPGKGEIHFAWVLEGRAIQDVWITPPRASRPPGSPAPDLPVTGGFYGTTLRIYDPGIDAWHILWVDPVKQYYTRQIGRARGDDIVQEGTDGTGAAVRWSFTKITPSSFHWLGERRAEGAADWQLQVEFFARRLRE